MLYMATCKSEVFASYFCLIGNKKNNPNHHISNRWRVLLKVGATGKPVLLRRGLSATIEEWLMAAEYILAAGNPNVILCERGIRSFDLG